MKLSSLLIMVGIMLDGTDHGDGTMLDGDGMLDSDGDGIVGACGIDPFGVLGLELGIHGGELGTPILIFMVVLDGVAPFTIMDFMEMLV